MASGSQTRAGPNRHRVLCAVAGDVGATRMDAVKILEKLQRLDWEYDEDADVLYLSIGRPRKATGVGIGQGVIVRYDEQKKEVVGLTNWACERGWSSR